jgi:hypothetical protein
MSVARRSESWPLAIIVIAAILAVAIFPVVSILFAVTATIWVIGCLIVLPFLAIYKR